MLSLLQEKLESAFKKLRGHGKISEANVSDAMREIRMGLLEADVDFKVAKDLCEAVRTKAVGEEVLRTVSPAQQIVKIFHDELTALLGGGAAELDIAPPQRILIAGLNGAGKTTTSAKLAAFLKKQGKRPLLIACDVFRPAAVKQLVILGESIGVPVYQPAEGEKDAVKVARRALDWVKEQGGGIAIFDTAGRQEVDDELLKELVTMKDVIEPREVLLVADAATGQQAVSVAKTFSEAIGVTGLIMTKLDGDARGGALLSMKQVTGCPIKFSGMGEKLDQLEIFHPERMADRILGMGDVVSLVEKAAEQIDEEDAMRMAKRMQSSKFDFNDFLSQMKFMKKLGSLESILGMLPGMGKFKDIKVDENRMKHTEAIVLSMTARERARPEIMNGSRRKRIANGAGRPVMEVNQLLKQFAMMQKMMKNKGMMRGLMGQMTGGGKGGMPKGFGF
ncbi:MAG: signal recognition particle protein [Verrucomicrobia bacterium]|nr:signal recognition particle protein [Verrucomicrobiota bacterium]